MWLVINFAGVIGIALVGLTYSLDPSEAVQLQAGQASVLDTSDTFPFANCYFFGEFSAYRVLSDKNSIGVRAQYDGLVGSPNVQCDRPVQIVYPVVLYIYRSRP